jgi:hypothetical protein
MSANTKDIIKNQLQIVLGELKEDYLKLKTEGKDLNEITLLGKDCKAQLEMLNLMPDDWPGTVEYYGCVSYERNGLCYTCHTKPAQPGHHNCTVCAGTQKVGRNTRSLDAIMRSLKEKVHNKKAQKTDIVTEAEKTFAV